MQRIAPHRYVVRACGRTPLGLPVDARNELKVLTHIEMLRDSRLLRGNVDALTDPRAVGEYGFAEHVCVPARGARQSGEHRYRRRLACAVHAEQREEAPLLDDEVLIVDGARAAIPFRQMHGAYRIHDTLLPLSPPTVASPSVLLPVEP